MASVLAFFQNFPFELFVNALLDGVAGFLAAPATESTLGWLRRAGDVDVQGLRLL